jgi:hypothetical protein
MESKLAQYAEQQLIEAAKRMTREQRLAAFIEHNKRVHELFRLGEQLRAKTGSAPTFALMPGEE